MNSIATRLGTKNFQLLTFDNQSQWSKKFDHPLQLPLSTIKFFTLLGKKIGINSKIFNHSIKNGNSSKDWKKIQLVPTFFKALLEKINHQFSIIDFGDHIFQSARKFWAAWNCFSGMIKSGF